jgi:hypothetical protein
VVGLLDDRNRAEAMGREAQRRVRDEFLGPRHLTQYLKLIAGLVGNNSANDRVAVRRS